MKFHIKLWLTMALLLSGLSHAQLKLGDKIPSLELKNTENKSINLNSFQNKIVLVDFWASWCAICRISNKKMAQLNPDPNKVAIIGLSLDENQAQWLAAIKKDKLKDPQLVDPHGFEAQSAVIFGVENLPAIYVFNTEGQLIAINPSEKELTQLINTK